MLHSVMSLGCWLFECDVLWCHWGADCLNAMFCDVIGVLTVWILLSVMSLGCWLFECYFQWCHWGADCLNVMLSDVTAGSDDHISLSVMIVCVKPRFFRKSTSQISSLMWCVCVCVWPFVTFWGVCWWLLNLFRRLCKWKSFVRAEFRTLVMLRVQAFWPETLCWWVGWWVVCNLWKDCSVFIFRGNHSDYPS